MSASTRSSPLKPQFSQGNASQAVVSPDTAAIACYAPGQSPVMMTLAGCTNGIKLAMPNKRFRYLELGCGNGLGIATLAASFPQGIFHAVDINPTQIDNAERLKEKAGLRNLFFHEADFSEVLEQTDIRPFDHISLNGVYSWVGESTRRHIQQIIHTLLKPGGTCNISYNAMPGWAAFLPLRNLFVQAANRHFGTTPERIQKAYRSLRLMMESGFDYTDAHPEAKAVFDELANKSLSYVAHEFFSDHWQPFSFSEVASDFANLGVYYCGNTELARNTGLDPAHAELRRYSDRLLNEDLRSIERREKHRSDAYCNGTKPPEVSDLSESLADLHLGALASVEAIVAYGGLSVSPEDTLILNALQSQTRTLGELEALPSLAGLTRSDLAQRVKSLITQRWISPFMFSQAFEVLQPETAFSGTFSYAHPLSEVLLGKTLFRDGQVYLPSPQTGLPIRVGFATAVILRATIETGVDQAITTADRLIADSGKVWIQDGEEIATPANRMHRLSELFPGFLRLRLPALLRSGVILSR